MIDSLALAGLTLVLFGMFFGLVLTGFFSHHRSEHPIPHLFLGGMTALLLVPFLLFLGAKGFHVRIDYPTFAFLGVGLFIFSFLVGKRSH